MCHDLLFVWFLTIIYKKSDAYWLLFISSACFRIFLLPICNVKAWFEHIRMVYAIGSRKSSENLKRLPYLVFVLKHMTFKKKNNIETKLTCCLKEIYKTKTYMYMSLKQTNWHCIKQTCTKQEGQNEDIENLRQYSFFRVSYIVDKKINL